MLASFILGVGEAQTHSVAKVTLNSWSSCLSLLTVGITGMYHHVHLCGSGQVFSQLCYSPSLVTAWGSRESRNSVTGAQSSLRWGLGLPPWSDLDHKRQSMFVGGWSDPSWTLLTGAYSKYEVLTIFLFCWKRKMAASLLLDHMINIHAALHSF